MLLRPAETMVPIIDWWTHLNKVASQCLTKCKKSSVKAGSKYCDIDYWRSIVYGIMMGLNTKDSTDELNDLLWEKARHSGERGRKPVPKRLGGKYPRFERKTPNESQINAFIRKLPKKITNNLVEWIFKAQIDIALELGVISHEVEGYIDYTDKYFYGSDTNATNPEIIGVYNGPGTNRARKYFGLMIGSGRTQLFVGLHAIQKGKKRILTIEQAVALLQQWGFHFKRIEGDREFSTYDIIGKLQQMGIPYTGTIKKTVPIKRIAQDYLAGNCKPVVPFTLNQHQFTYYKLGSIPVHLIMKTDPGKRMRDLRKDFRAGKITPRDALKHIHVFVTTEKAPRKQKVVRWGLALAQNFRNRWRIETGFRDESRVFPTCHARSNACKYFWMGMRVFAYNAWQIQRALHWQMRKVPKVWKKGPTLRRFGRVQARLCAL